MPDKSEHEQKTLTDKDLKQISEVASTIRYGSITLIIQDGKVIQIEKNEKIRLV